ncbi:two-component system sensor histidine kinase CreC [Methylomonas methanica]|uniref:histidine kinase n=1 Tax=Methylomonas methanica (strain DSM 25384 / MC09) TaxID=857087 RepID=F9ZXQ8_METMM|nr:two-component system sensor histidine kinase CreC [Methylomonas methanica]AEG02213.1 integral membrane sensor signal transduction histidine kinase [Methylomonas methanica MC09]
MTVRSRILLVFLLALASGFFALERWLSLELRPRYYQSFEEPLVDMANILAEIAGQEFDRPDPDFDRLQSALQRVYQRDPKADIYGLRKNDIDIRVYITDRNGMVIFDSYHKAVGQNFSKWRDVYLTLQGKYGVRSSPLTEIPLRRDDREARSIAYIAAPIYRNGDLVGVLSVGKPKVNVTQFILTARRDLLWAVAGVALLALATVTLLYLWISRPLHQVAQFAQRIAGGETLATPDLGDNEIGGVANAIAAMRQALDGKQYIERYTQTLAHELKSPLTSIKASAELLLEEMPPEQRQRFLDNIQAENQRALNLIQRLLELAAVENRQGIVEQKPLQLNEVIAEIADALHAALLRKKLVLNVDGNTDSVIVGERFLIKQALFNLIENAVAFSPIGGKITLVIARDPERTTITVRDQGPGVPDYAKDRIFERFYSLPSPGSPSRGSGLGLSFVREVMELHHGIVTLASDAQGTKATMEFPMANP